MGEDVDQQSNKNFKFISAKCLTSGTSLEDNYILIDKGDALGIRSNMCVLSNGGVVGFIVETSENYAVVQSLLNRETKLECKIRNTDAAGVLVRDKKSRSYAYMRDIPNNLGVKEGDVVITNGSSNIFQEGLIIGTVDEYRLQEDENYYTLKIKLAADFKSVKNILVVDYHSEGELINSSKEVTNAE